MAGEDQNLIKSLQERLKLAETLEDILATHAELQEKFKDASDEARQQAAELYRISRQNVREQEKLNKQKEKDAKLSERIRNAYGSISQTLKETFSGEKFKNTVSEIGESLQNKAASGAARVTESFAQWAPQIAKVAAVVGTGLLVGLSGVALIAGTLVQQFFKIDEAASDLAKTSGILDQSLGTVLISATESSSILGGNLEFAAEAAGQLVSQLSPAIPLTGALVGNIASLSERFGLGADVATKFARIISENANLSIGTAAGKTEDLVDSLGKLGPAVVRNITESYDTVINSFGLGTQELVQQGLAATQLGISLEQAAETSKGLLDISNSISSEFRASALLGQQLNLQKARQLAFEGDIVGANNEILDQVSQLGDLSQFNTFQRQALAEATGKTVAELQRELQIRKQIGRVGRIEEATRRDVLTRFEAISRRISGAFFRIVSSPEIQSLITRISEGIIDFLEGPGFQNFVGALANFVDNLGRIANGEFGFWEVVFSPSKLFSGGGPSTVSLQDGIITNRGEVVSTDPKDYIIATQTPADLVGGGDNATKEVMKEVRDLLQHLKRNGVKAGDTYMNGQKVSTSIAMSNR